MAPESRQTCHWKQPVSSDDAEISSLLTQRQRKAASPQHVTASFPNTTACLRGIHYFPRARNQGALFLSH